ncbi:hypothetical protein [Streptomyces sp. NPDC007346]|uniref:hypothetical protein n=1 Tax=Streptomyces sp. NPDC007346 TaxID=3154682 RepID=UPI0034533BE2
MDRYELSNSEMHLIYEASDLLVRKCMKEKGAEWKRIDIPASVANWRNRLHFGVIEIKVARAFGYRVPSELTAPSEVREVVDRMKRRFAALDTARARQAEKCQDAAGGELTREAKASFATLNKLKEETYAEAQRAPEVIQAERAWSACMRKSGLEYATPHQASTTPKWGDRSVGKASPDEVTAAVADVKCKHRVKLVAVRFAAEQKLERRAIKDNSEYLRTVAAANARYLANARAVLSQG